MGKTYEALMEAERLRATQDPAALARQLARAAGERESLSVELRACQEQLAVLVARVDAARTIDPAVLDDLGSKIARLTSEQERLATEPRQHLEAAIRLFKEELNRHSAALQGHSEEVAGIAQQLEEIRVSVAPPLATIRREIDELRGLGEEHRRAEQAERESLAGRAEILQTDLDSVRERLAAADDEHRRLQQRWEEQLAEQRHVLSSLSAEATRIVQGSVDESQTAQRGLLARLAVVEQAQSESDVRLHGICDALQSSRVGRTHSDDEVEALRAQVALLVEAQGRQQELVEGIERARASADDAVRRVLAIDDAQTSSVTVLRQQMETLRAESARLLETVDSVQASLAGPLRSAGEIETLRAQVASLVEAQSRHQQLVDGVSRAQASADEMARRVTAIDKEHASSLALLQQQVVELQLDRGALQDALDALRSSLAQQLESAAETEAWRGQMASLVEAQLRQQELVDNVGCAQATADEAVRRVAAIDEAQGAGLAAVREQVAALQADGETLREGVGALQLSLARQLEASREIEALRAQVAPLVKAQVRQRELIVNVGRAQSSADEALRRVAMIDKGEAADLTILQQQLAGLVADKAKLDQVIETRFELLCGILDETMQGQKDEIDRVIASFTHRLAQPDAELQAKVVQLEAYVDELRTGIHAQPEPERTLRKTLTNGWIRRTSSRKLQ